MMIRFLFLLSLICSFQVLNGQTLKRKASLGARVEEVENGIIISKVVEGTAVALKFKEGDVLLKCNEIKLDMASLSEILASSFEGDPVHFLVQRQGKEIKIKGKFSGRPKEVSEVSEVIYDQAAFREGQLRVIINKPKKEGRMPAILFIPGYTCTSIDNLRDDHPYKRHIDAFVEAGFVALRIEKSGLGDSYNTPTCESCDLKDEIENFEVGLKKLQSLPYVDTEKIIIVGHSMGGVIAPALSAKHQVAGVIVYGTTAKSWFEYQIEMYRVQNRLAGMEPLEHEASVVSQYELNYRFFVQNESLEELAKNTVHDSILRTQWMYDGQGKIYSRNAEYWRQIQGVNHLENWKNTQAKVLVQFGESDFQAFSRADHEQIVWTVNHYHPGNATLMTYPLTDHYYAQSGTMQDAYDKFANQQYLQLFEEFNFEVTRSEVEWALQVVNSN